MAETSRCCAPVFHGKLSTQQAEDLAVTFRAIADPARLRVLSFIGTQPAAEACVCNLVDVVGLSQPTVSHHLKVLHDAGLLSREKRGTWVYYRLDRERLRELREALETRQRPPTRARTPRTLATRVSLT